MSNALLVIDQVQIRRDADGRYCLNDLHKASDMGAGKAPSEWKKNKSTDALIEELEKQTREIPLVTVEGCHGGTFVAKELVYAYAMWVSPAFHLKVIKAYDALVTGQMNMQQQVAAMGRKQLAAMIIEQEEELEAAATQISRLTGRMATVTELTRAHNSRQLWKDFRLKPVEMNEVLMNVFLQDRLELRSGYSYYPTEKGVGLCKVVTGDTKVQRLQWDTSVLDREDVRKAADQYAEAKIENRAMANFYQP